MALKLPKHECTDHDVGNGYAVTVTVPYDDINEAPWELEDGHGPVSDWERRDKQPGEMILCTDRGAHRFYDFAAAVKQAKAEGWDSPPYKTGTPGERAHRAALADYDRLRRWCNDQWHYVGVCVTVTRNGEEVGSDSLWGIEDDTDYWHEVAVELASSIIKDDMDKRRCNWLMALREARESRYWATRDVVTA